MHFAGMQNFENPGLVYPTDFRKYNPALGRWMSPDPLAGDVTNPQSLNRYAYVLNNPVSNTDPQGLETCTNPEDGTSVDCITSESWAPAPGDDSAPVIHVDSWAPTPGGDNVGLLPSQSPEIPGSGRGSSGGGSGASASTSSGPGPLPSCFGVFLREAGNQLLTPSLSLSTVSDVGSVAALGASQKAAALAIAIRSEPILVAPGSGKAALRAARIARAVSANRLFAASQVLEKVSGALLVSNVVFAEIQGLRAEIQAFQAGSCK